MPPPPPPSPQPLQRPVKCGGKHLYSRRLFVLFITPCLVIFCCKVFAAPVPFCQRKFLISRRQNYQREPTTLLPLSKSLLPYNTITTTHLSHLRSHCHLLFFAFRTRSTSLFYGKVTAWRRLFEILSRVMARLRLKRFLFL